MAGIGHNQSTVSLNGLSQQDRLKLKNSILELNDSMTRVAAERDLQKETINNIFDTIGFDKKLLRKMAKVYYTANFNEEVENNKQFEEFYSEIVKSTVANDPRFYASASIAAINVNTSTPTE